MVMTLNYDRPPFTEDYDPDRTVFLTAETAGDLDARLDAIHAQAATWPMPVYVAIAPASDHEGAPGLSIAIGRDQSVLQYERDLPSPDGGWSQTELLWSWNGTSDQETGLTIAKGPSPGTEPGWRVIPATDAREAARQFITTGGKLPDCITWRPQ